MTTNEKKQKHRKLKTTELPEFLKKENIMDANHRRPGEKDYDPSTLFIPPEFFKKFNGFKRSYWRFKREHFDSII